MNQISNATTDDFQEQVLRAEQPVVVDFHADWCGPCRAIGPVVKQLAEEHQDIKFVKVDVDESAEIAALYQVQSIPNLVLFRNGEVVDRVLGAQPAVLRSKVAALAGDDKRED
jgi:thioredoxin 1